ncbi:MAG: PilZ domain-containing protein [Thermoanaerobaculia bacterium]
MKTPEYATGRRAALRIPGEGFTARVEGVESEASVVNVSQKGIALATREPLPADQRLSLELTGPAGTTIVDFYVVRCEELKTSSPGPDYISAGLFVARLRRKDLPKVVHEQFP